MNLQNVTLSLPRDLAARLDDVRFNQRYGSRSAAAVEVLALGLKALASRPAETR